MHKPIAMAVLIGFVELCDAHASYEFNKLDLNIEAQSCISKTYVLTHPDRLYMNLVDFGRKVRGWGDPDFNDFIDRSGLPSKLGGEKKTGGEIAVAIYEAELEYFSYLSKTESSMINRFLDFLFFKKIRSSMLLAMLQDSTTLNNSK